MAPGGMAQDAPLADAGPVFRSTAAPLLGLLAIIVSPADGIDFWLPMGFIIAGALLFLWEVSMPGFFIAIPATVAVVLGVVGLFVPGFFTSPWVVLVGVLVALPVTAVVIKAYKRFAPPGDAPTTSTGASLVGREGIVTVEVEPETTRGKVRITGAIWSARSAADDTRIPVGTRVIVQEAVGVHVVVAPKQPVERITAEHEREPAKPEHAEPTEPPRKEGRPSD